MNKVTKYILHKIMNNKKILIIELKLNKYILNKLCVDKENKKYCRILLQNITNEIKLIYKYNDNSYWFNMLKNIDKYMLINNNAENKNKLSNILENEKNKYQKYQSEIQEIIVYMETRHEKYNKKAKIFDCDSASKYKPKNEKTIMIRLMDSHHLELNSKSSFVKFPEIEYKDNFLKIIEIYIDDVDKVKYEKEYNEKINHDNTIIPFSITEGTKLLNEINDLTNGNLNNYDLVTHCRLGMSRSTAVFIALNEIYNLGYKNLKILHNHYNQQIYKELLESQNYINNK